jgi:epoxide hydrolase-like predicted phosphatase
MTIRAVLFDWGGVLTSPPLLGLRAYEATQGYRKRQITDWIFHSGLPAVGARGESEDDFALLEKGKISLDEFHARLLPRSEEHLGAPLDAETYASICALFVVDGGIEGIYWPMVHKARELRLAGYRTGMLTNQIAAWRKFWRDSVPVDEFEVVVDSCEVGLRKPEPEIMHLACARLGVDPTEAVLLDDSPRNIAGAEAVGMAGILVRDPLVAITDLDALLKERADPHYSGGRAT